MTWINKGLLLTTSAVIALSASACATFPGMGIQGELNDTSREVAQTQDYQRPAMGHGVQEPRPITALFGRTTMLSAASAKAMIGLESGLVHLSAPASVSLLSSP